MACLTIGAWEFRPLDLGCGLRSAIRDSILIALRYALRYLMRCFAALYASKLHVTSAHIVASIFARRLLR